MIKLLELLGGLFQKEKPVKARKIGEDETTIVYEVTLDQLRLGNQKAYGEVLKLRPDLFSIYVKSINQRGKRIFNSKFVAQDVKRYLDKKGVENYMEDEEKAWIFSFDKKYVDFEKGMNEIKNHPRVNFKNNKELFDFLKKNEKEFNKSFLDLMKKDDEYFEGDDMDPEEIEYVPEDDSVWSPWGDVTINYDIKKENEDWNPISFKGANFYYIIY